MKYANQSSVGCGSVAVRSGLPQSGSTRGDEYTRGCARFQLRLAAALVYLLFVVSCCLNAQVRSATISGTVSDVSGAVVGGAHVTVFETKTSQGYEVTSNDSGSFTVPYLPAGTYTVTVTQPGFQSVTQSGVAVGTGDDIHVHVELKVGAATETIDVKTESQIQVDSPVVQSVIGQEVIASIPNIAHNPLAYVQLEQGVSTRSAGAGQQNTNSFGIGINGRRQISDFAINGGQAFQNDIQVDGLSTQGSGWNEVTVITNQDAIQETRALVNNYSAQYGRAHGVVTTTTKGGTDTFHGLLFMRNRSSFFAANSYSNNAQSIAKPPSEIWTYGGAVGGPIVRKRAFFFGSFEGLFWDNPRVFLRTVPTALERAGDFSQTKVSNNGVPVALNIYDPFNVKQTGSNVYQRALVPGAKIANPNPIALNILKNYPLPNRTPQDAFNTNNFTSTGLQTFRKANVNARIDVQLRSNDYLYVSGGYTNGTIINPLIWGNGTLYNPASSTGDERRIADRNPYLNIGNTLILSPTLVLDLRYGVNRIQSDAVSDIVPNNFDYGTLGIDPATAAQIPARVIPTFVYTGGNYSVVNYNNSINKNERQTNHEVAGSISKAAGKWNFKFGGEMRVLLANYTDTASSAQFTLTNALTQPTVNSSGGIVGTPAPADAGNPLASFLLGAGSVGIPSGQTVKPAFLHQYGAIFTQNDWHPNTRLTINLGLRWDWQPGVEERYGKVSSIDLNGTNPFGGRGAIYFPGSNGAGRRLWDTDWTNLQPRLGFAFRAHETMVVRGGAGVSFLPSNTGFFGGPYLFGTTSFATYTNSQVFGFGVQNGKPAGTFDSSAVNQLVAGTNANQSAPQLYGGVGGPRFPTHGYKNSYVYQGNLHVQQVLGKGWASDIGYNVEIGKRLMLGSSYTPNSDQFLPNSLLQSWRTDYIARNGTGNAGSDQVANPFQPNPSSLLPFAGNLGKATMPRDQTLWPYPYLGTQAIQQNRGFSSYHALQASLKKDFSGGFVLGANFTWSKSLGVDGGTVQNNFASEGTGNSLYYLADIRKNKRFSPNDVPIRFSSYSVYELPFGRGRRYSSGNKLVSALISGYRVSGTYIWQSGIPQQISGLSTGALNFLPDRNPAVPLTLPKSFQHFYDGKTAVTMPYSGRVITPCANCFLKFNPDAFNGRTVQVANGSTQADAYWYGTASTNYGGLRTDPVNNVTASFERDVHLSERYRLNLQVNATNLFNHTQFAATSFNGNLGTTQTTSGNVGYGNNASYGTHSLSTLDARLVEMQARFVF